jgi:hypothetical protein
MPVNRAKEALAVAAVRAGLLRIRDDGSVWRMTTLTRSGRRREIEPVRADRGRPDGYRFVSVSASGREFKVLVHRLVWLASGEAIPDGHDVNHKDGDRGHNRLANLEPLTPGGNLAHSYRELGRWRPSGERNNRGRLTREQVREIHELAREGAGQRELGRKFGVTHRAIRMILTGASWPDEYPAGAS